MNNYFSPEFLNRFDGIIEFKALSKENLLHIVELMLKEVNDMLASQHLHITVPKDVEEKLVDLGYNPAMGARPLRRTIQDQIEDGIAEYYLDHPKAKELEARLTEDGKIEVTQTQNKANDEAKEQTETPEE